MFSNPFKSKKKDPSSLKDFVQEEKKNIADKLFGDEVVDLPTPEDQARELWRTRCTEFVEFILFNASTAEIDDNDSERTIIDFRDDDMAKALLQELEDLKVQLKSNGQHSDLDIELPDEEDDW